MPSAVHELASKELDKLSESKEESFENHLLDV